jgi:hypothetical protein
MVSLVHRQARIRGGRPGRRLAPRQDGAGVGMGAMPHAGRPALARGHGATTAPGDTTRLRYFSVKCTGIRSEWVRSKETTQWAGDACVGLGRRKKANRWVPTEERLRSKLEFSSSLSEVAGARWQRPSSGSECGPPRGTPWATPSPSICEPWWARTGGYVRLPFAEDG